MKEKRQHLSDILLYLAFAAAGILLTLLIFLPIKGQIPTTVRVTVDGSVYGTYSLDRDQTITITQDDGKENVLVIEDENVYMKEANCRNQICVRTGKISRPGQSITCLPNRVSAVIEGGEDNGFDAVIR